MIETAELHTIETMDIVSPVRQRSNESDMADQQVPGRSNWFRQILRFGLIGGLNTLVDVSLLNSLLWLFPTTSTSTLLMYNALAFSVGAVNSFLLNKYWTFEQKQRTTHRELARFTLTTLCGMGWSSFILWLASNVFYSLAVNTTVWANTSKVISIASTALLSFLVMRFWVFIRSPQKDNATTYPIIQADHQFHNEPKPLNHTDTMFTTHSLSVVLPVYNEEEAIASTIENVLDTLKIWIKDFEIIPVNDGSSDHTGNILATIARNNPQVRVVTHEQNQGYGAALADGFAAASKELTFFMDSDGQFDIHDLPRLLAFIDDYDAVIGYRIHRQDTWMRKLNAWGWKVLIGITLGVHVRDIDCAFKLLRTDFLHQYAPQTRGAMINAEMLHKLKCAGYTYQEVGVRHLPRKGGRATGAHPRVIARAFRELFIYTYQWRHENVVRAPSMRAPQ